MKDFYLSAKLTGPLTIRVILLTPVPKDERNEFSLVIDGKTIETLRIDKSSFNLGMWLFDLKANNEIILGHNYEVVVEHFGSAALDVSSYLDTPDFDERYFYPGDDLGCSYSPKGTSFVLWAPLASRVVLKIAKPGEYWEYHLMERSEQGVYRFAVSGDYELARYRYLVMNNGLEKEATDPYAKGSTQNGEDSVVLDFAKTTTDFHDGNLPKIERYTDAIIYETSVRDISSDLTTSIKDKGRFLGMVQPGAKTAKGNHAGFDYLVSLGITHIQLLPIYDFKTVDEKDPSRLYNWGYDPSQYFVPEGSFASVLDDPYSRIRDLKTLVACYHEAGIRINMDVVYNHVYQYQFSVFEKVVPGYYFRRKKNGKMSDGSFCGNDVATEKPMVRKMIVDACIYWVKEFGIDGYRFDLMGIIDAETMRQIVDGVRAIKPDFMFYGEGWNMPTELPEDQRCSMNRADHLPDLAFFNDTFRDTVKGGTMDDRKTEPGYVLGAANFRLGFKYSYVGSCLDLVFPAKFRNAYQSINYVECHDNGTFFDKLEACHESDDPTIRMKRVKLAMAAVMLSYGIPFFHMGQEIGQSKNGNENSYKSGDRFNKFDYRLLDERPEMVSYFTDLCRLRKMMPFLRLDKAADIEKTVQFEDLEDGALLIEYFNKDLIAPYQNVIVIFNPTPNTIYYELEDYYQIILAASGLVIGQEIYGKNLMINGISAIVGIRK